MNGWRFQSWTAEHPLPIGTIERATLGARVLAGEVIGSGAVLASATRVAGARRLGLDAGDLPRVLRVAMGTEVIGRTVIARTGRRFARAVTAPHDGRLVQMTSDGDLFIAPVVGRWVVRSTLDGTVTRSDDAVVTVEGAAWGLEGVAAYGPDATGELVLGVDSPRADLSSFRLDVRLAGKILIAGGKVSAEALTRAHACGLAGIVGGAIPAAGLRMVYGDGARASGGPTREDRPTVLSLLGFGNAAPPREIFEPLVSLAGSRASIHTASARLFAFGPADATDIARDAPPVGLAADYASVRALTTPCEPVADFGFASEHHTAALRGGDDVFPAANVRGRESR